MPFSSAIKGSTTTSQTHTHSHSPTKCGKGQDRAFERGREKKSNGIGWRDRKGKKSSLSCISLAKQITLFVLRNQTSKARIITIALYETGTHRVLPFVKKRPIEILRWMLTFLYWMCWRNEKLARKNIKEFIHNIHKQSHPANERVFVWVSEWKKKSWRNNVNCRALYFKLRPVRETLSFTNSFPSSWEKNLDTIKGEFQSEQESNFSLRRKKIYI